MANSYLRFWGVRGSYPAPFASHMRIGGNTPCVELRAGGNVLLFDAGTGIIPLGHALEREPERSRVSIFLTHYHWDHICGLPYFQPAFTPGREIDFYGPADTPAELEAHIAQPMRAPYFPVATETWRASVRYHAPCDETIAIGPIAVSSFVLHHPGHTLGYRIELAGKRIVYCPDNEICFVNQRVDAMRDEFDREEHALLEALKEEQRERVVELMRDADFVIHDAQYTPADYRRKRGWGHSCYVDTVNAAIDAGVKQLFLFSYDPTYDDDRVDALHAHSRELVMERQAKTVCHKTCEGMIIELDE